jgi:circadian clock protein KaiC
VKLLQYMQLFAFFDPKLLDDKVLFVDLGAAVAEGVDCFVRTVTERVEAFGANLVAIDSFRAVDEGPKVGRRPMVFDLAVQLTALGTTTLLVGEYARGEYSAFSEFAIADCIVRIGVQSQELTSVREIEILKLRGANYVTGRHFCEITGNGFSVYPRVRAPEQITHGESAPTERLATGIEGLDEMLAGGLPRTSTTLVHGATGAGKTTIGLHFLLEGALRGERGILFALEETPDQLRTICASLDLPLAAREREGLITIFYASPVELSTDRFLFQARRMVEKLGAKRAVFDGLTSMALGVPSDRRFKELVYAIAKHLRFAGTTVLMTMEAEQAVGTLKLSGLGASFVADSLIQLRYLEFEGRLERAVAVIKARGTKHATEPRRLTIGSGGMRINPGMAESVSRPLL